MKKNDSHKKILIIGISNVAITVAHKALMLSMGSVGFPVIIVAVLWILIYKEKLWAYCLYSVYAWIVAFLGIVLGLVLTIGYAHQGHNPTPYIFAVALGADYLASWLWLRRL